MSNVDMFHGHVDMNLWHVSMNTEQACKNTVHVSMDHGCEHFDIVQLHMDHKAVDMDL